MDLGRRDRVHEGMSRLHDHSSLDLGQRLTFLVT